MFIPDCLPIIYGFLQPIEITRLVRVSRLFRMGGLAYLRQAYQTSSLEQHACPLCGCLKADTDLSHDTTFYDNLYGDTMTEEENRMEYIHYYITNKTIHTAYNHMSYIRERLLCGECDENECLDYELPIYFPYKGTRTYILEIVADAAIQWAFLIEKSQGVTKWNEFRIILSQV